MAHIVYMIGTSGSGKTTIANALKEELDKRGVKQLQLIDGDVIRQQFGGLFGYTYEERMKNNQAVRVVVQYLLDNNISVILTQVAPYEEVRRKMRGHFGESYVEIYVKCSYEECVRRDPKGYYRNYKDGKMENLNGANDIFEIPSNSDLVIDTEEESVPSAVDKLIKYFEEKNFIINLGER